ncbi:MAG: hypothetical protein Q4C67_07545 [Deinococcus sp.]|nr:hypothetical protein [Deinococcus sp.]
MGSWRRAGQGVYVHPAQTHEEVICASVFDGFQTWRLAWEERWPVARVVGFQHSALFATPHLLGGRLDEFDRVLTGRLRAVAPGGQIAVEREVTALLLGG